MRGDDLPWERVPWSPLAAPHGAGHGTLRVLFVDDDTEVLSGIENALWAHDADVHASFATSGKEALERLEVQTFDTVVTDMRMPHMGGGTLLHRVRLRYPRVVRIVLSGHADVEDAVRAAPTAHDFLLKPCDARTLVEALERGRALQRLIGDEVVRAAAGFVPERPRVYAELAQVFGRGTPPAARIARVMEGHPVATRYLLQVANGTHFRTGPVVDDVVGALTYVDPSFVRGLVLGLAAFEHLLPFAGMEQLRGRFEHGLQCAVSASAMLANTPRAAEDAFLAGLLHDVGELLMLRTHDNATHEAIAESVRRGASLHEAELLHTGTTHAHVGAYMLSTWGLGAPVIYAVLRHHDDETSGEGGTRDAGRALRQVDRICAEEEKRPAEAWVPLGLPTWLSRPPSP